jgi:hypothetical protein
MSINFNVDPYYDDYSADKNFHRILYKPGVAVQARELTQSQTILQNQITSFADNIFKQNSPVNGGQVTTNFNCYYIKLQSTYNSAAVDVTQFINLLVTNASGTVSAKVLAVVPATGTSGLGDPPTLIVSYKSGVHFVDNDVIYDVNSNLAAQAISLNSSGLSSVASISKGVFYVLGNFVQVSDSTVVLSKYSNSPSLRIGLTITETIYDYIDDSSLLDPALGASNYQAPGADRYVISLALDTRPLLFGDDQNFIELVKVENGSVYKMVDGSVYATIDDYFAKREYETNGDYVVNDFKLTPKYNTSDANTYIMNVGKGLAYVHGYRVENPAPVDIVSNRARTTANTVNESVYSGYGNFFYVSNLKGANSSFFDITTEQAIDLHCVYSANVNISTNTAYNSTLVASGYVRGLVYDHDLSDASSNTYVYKLYVNDLQNNVFSGNVVSSTATTITLPSTASAIANAYIGVVVQITGGTDSGDFRTITSYNGSTKVATVNNAWSVNPDATSTFSLNFDTTSVESILTVNKASYPATIYGKSDIDNTGKNNGLSSGYTILENPNAPELIFNVGNPYVKTITSGSYTTTHEIRNVGFTSSGSTLSAQISYTGSYSGVISHIGPLGQNLSPSQVLQQYTIIVTNKGTNTTINNGDIIPWVTDVVSSRTVQLSASGSVATFSTTTSDLSPFTATIVAKVFVQNAVDTNQNVILKYKTPITANSQTVFTSGTQVNTYTFVDDSATSTGQVYIQNAGIVSPGSKQSLYLSDVYNISKIIDTGSPSTTPTLDMLSNPAYDVSSNYIFDNGQRDNYYDHSSITLKPGAPNPKGNLWILLNYFKHSGGDGYFSVSSYPTTLKGQDFYRTIPSYQSKSGNYYNLRDCLDFRPARLNAQSSFVFRYGNTNSSTQGLLLPVDGTLFLCNYFYYLGRKDLLVLTKDRNLQIVEGSPSLNPNIPVGPDASLVIANIEHRPYTGYLPSEIPNGVGDLSVQKVQHKRYTMQDIAGLDSRIGQIEYYTALSALEQSTSNQQITDAYGLNRFKNGIMTDDFSSFATADTVNMDYSAGINKRTRQMSALQKVNNFPLKNLALAYNLSTPSTSLLSSLDYSITTDGIINYFSLPYTTANVVTQKYASRTTNINPFSVTTSTGVVSLSPNVDTWVDNNYAPSLLITDPNLQVFQSSNNISVLSVGDWKTVSATTVLSGTSISTSSSTVNTVNHTGQNWWPGADLSSSGLGNSAQGDNTGIGQSVTTTTTSVTDTYTTTLQQQQSNVLGPYNKIGNTYSINNGYITDISILPWIRPQEVIIRTNNLLFNSTLHNFFDNVNVDNFVRKPNIIELVSVNGTFNQGDVVGYVSGGRFTATAVVIDVFIYVGTSKVRLYVAADGYSSTYNNGTSLINATFNSDGSYTTVASGTISSTIHYGGVVTSSNTTNSTITLSPLASSVNGFYNGNTVYIASGSGLGSSATITGYDGTTKTANVSPTITTNNGSIYSIGSFQSNEQGKYSGVFIIPPNTFHNGQRIFSVDNRVNNNLGSITTSAQGTFYSEGLHTTAQQLEFGASPSGAKGTFTQTNQKTVSYTTSYTSTSSISTRSPYDPLAQSFIIDATNYPNGCFLADVKLFFSSKPTSDKSPVTISIVGTLNGYPNGDTLDHSIVTLTPDNVNVSQNPQYLDSTAYTQFTFNSPVYIRPGVMYAIIIKSNSDQYTVWTAANGDTALPSSVKNQPTDPMPTNISKITTAPYVGGLFISQNAQTWTADQNQSLMFTIDRCVFDTTKTPTIRMVVPKLLPQRALIEQSVNYYNNANNVSNTVTSVSNSNILVDAFNLTTTDFIPTSTGVLYSYSATLTSGISTNPVAINPGKYGTAMYDDIYLNDNNGERVLVANSTTSFSMYALLNSTDNAVSPIISDAGTSLYAIQYSVNNCSLSNNLITLVNGGSGYNVSTTSVTISSPTGKNGTQAYATANVVSGVIKNIYITTPGSGYITTPTITINDANSSPGTGAIVTIAGETSSHGGPALCKYFTKKVVLNAGFDSGDLNVYMTAYRPVNTDILVYYKILNRQDTQKFEDGNWQLMTKTQNSDTLYSQSRTDLYEYTFAPGTSGVDQGYVSYTSTNGQTYTTFSQFAIKVVLVTTDNTSVPFLSDLRCIALPSNVNTSA